MDFSAIPINSLALSEVIITLASALGCGLLIGLERERSKQRENQQSFAGLRSFAICALLGAICFLFGVNIGIVGALIIGGIVIFSMKNQTEDLGSTTELAFVMTYFIGAMCLWNTPLAAGLAVLLTIILMTKHPMHSIAGKWITEAEFKDGIFLLALILIALPLTPNTPLWGFSTAPHKGVFGVKGKAIRISARRKIPSLNSVSVIHFPAMLCIGCLVIKIMVRSTAKPAASDVFHKHIAPI